MTSSPATASWAEGDWTFLFELGNGISVQNAVGPLIRELQKVLLPARPGWFYVSEAGDGAHSNAAWAIDSAIYSAFDYHDPAALARLVASERFVTP